MGNLAKTVIAMGVPLLPDQQTDLLRRAMLNRLERTAGSRHSISDRNLPTPAERAALEARRNALRSCLRSGDQSIMALRIVEMFDGFPTVRMTERQAADTASAYVSVVAGLPTWAVERAVRICIGRATPFPPSAGEFRAACELAVQEVREELADLDHILDANICHEATPDERAKRKADFAALRGDLGLDKPFDPPRILRPPVVEAPSVAAEPRPLRLSDEALLMMGVRPQVEEQAD